MTWSGPVAPAACLAEAAVTATLETGTTGSRRQPAAAATRVTADVNGPDLRLHCHLAGSAGLSTTP